MGMMGFFVVYLKDLKFMCVDCDFVFFLLVYDIDFGIYVFKIMIMIDFNFWIWNFRVFFGIDLLVVLKNDWV